MTILLRLVQASDLADLYQLAEFAGKGLTSLLPDEAFLRAQIEASVQSVARTVIAGTYFFVLMVDNHLVGCSAIHTHPGNGSDFYTYKIGSLIQTATEFSLCRKQQYLEVCTDFNQATVLCTLFLLPAYRQRAMATLLSYARLAYIQYHTALFPDPMIAEIRGVLTADGMSPFWDAVGRHFYMEVFDRADRLCGLGQKNFIAERMPKFPIYIDVLPTAAQAVIGKPHPEAAPAQHLLEKQGFVFTRYVDIFDAGPTIIAQKKDLHCHSAFYSIVAIKKTLPESTKQYLYATGDKKNFIASIGPGILTRQGIEISAEMADTLNVGLGDSLGVTVF